MGELAKKLKLSRQGFWKKLHNKSEFKQSEIAAISKELNLDADTERRIFFTLNVD
jgi:DNA-binding phage protein